MNLHHGMKSIKNTFETLINLKLLIIIELITTNTIDHLSIIKNNCKNNLKNFNKMNKTDNELLESLLGPVRDPLSTVIPMSILYIVILITGIIGNVCTCIVIVYNRYMHTATNFYLFSLAVSDLLLLILGLPQELFLLWQKYPYIFGEFFCVVRGLSSETSTNASILTITAFTIERYVAICHPLKSHTMSQLPRAIKTILIIWAISAICALPVAWQFGIIFMINKSHQLRNISKQCGMKVIYIEYSFETSAIVFFLIPITLISILYVLIGLNLKYNSQQQQQSHSNPNQNQNIIVLNQQSPTNATTTTTTTTTSLRLSSSARELSTMDNFVNNSSNTTNDSKLNTSNKDNSTDLKHSHLNHQSSLDINNNNSKNQRMSILYQRNNSISSSNQKQIASRRSVIKMLVAVVIAFFFCYSPFHAQRVLATSMHRYKLKSPAIHYVYVLLTHISGITYYLSATINPILYQLMSRKFRLAFKDTFHSCCPCIRRTIPEITYMNIVGSNNYINCASGHYISGYGSSYQLSRVPSFQNSLNAYHNANCAYRRPSSFTNVTNPSILRNNNAVSSTKSIHSFDTNILSTSSSSKRPKLKSTMKSESTSADSAELLDTSLSPTKIAEKQIDYQTTTTSTNIINVTNATALITTTTTTSKSTSSSSLNNPTTTTTLVKFKQFLEVPSVKF